MKKIWTIVLLSILLGFGTGIPAAKASSPAPNVSFDPASGVVTITGQLDSAGGSPAAVQVRNPLNSLDYLDQQAAAPDGSFRFSYTLKNRMPGNYTVTAGGGGAVMSAAFHADPAPSAELSAELSPPQPDGRNGWYVHPVRVGIISSSELSAGSRIEYRLNEGSWAVYTSPFMVDSDGINTLEYRSTDGNGIAGTVQSVTVKLDSAAPVTSASAGPADGKNGWYRSAPVVSLTAADAVSSVARTVYRLNDGPWSEYSQPVTVSVYGSSRLEYRSIDQAGNEEQARSLTLNVDSAAPALRLALDKTTLWPPNNKTVSVTASVYASDSGSGIASVVLTSITSNEPLQPDDIQDAQYGTADTSFRLRASRAGSGNGRIYTITYTATDQAGNQITASANVRVPHDPSGR